MKGRIKAISERDKNFGITFNGTDWYSGFNNDKPDWLIKGESNGTEIEFEYVANKVGDRTYNNIVGGTLKKVESEPTPIPVKEPQEPVIEKPSEPYISKDEQTRKEIRLAVSLKAGVETACKSVALKTWDESEGEKENLKDRIIYFAEEFDKWLKQKSEQNFP